MKKSDPRDLQQAFKMLSDSSQRDILYLLPDDLLSLRPSLLCSGTLSAGSHTDPNGSWFLSQHLIHFLPFCLPSSAIGYPNAVRITAAASRTIEHCLAPYAAWTTHAPSVLCSTHHCCRGAHHHELYLVSSAASTRITGLNLRSSRAQAASKPRSVNR